VQTGTTVRWTNLDADQHSVTEVNGLFDSGLFGQNGQWQYTFNAPGTYEYYCTLHGTYMTGWVIVQGNPTTATPGTTTTPGSTVTAGTTTTPGSTVTAGTTTTPGSTGTPGSTVTAGTTGTPQATTTPGTCAIEFVDVQPGSTFYPFVQCLACRNVLGGYADGTFRPNNGVTRGQLSKIVSNAAGWSESPGTQTFEDVAPGHTFYTFVERMASRGIIGGYVCGSDGEPCGPENRPYFRPNNPATRGQITKIVSESRGYNDPVTGQSFEDVAPGSTFHLWVERLASRGIMSGYACGSEGEPCGEGNRPYFRPGNNATRGQVAKIVSNSFFPECQP
jgi:amidase